MSSQIKIQSANFMESQSESESLRARIREVEDENQELRAQNLTQNRTIVELRNEIVLLRIQMNELAETSTLLRKRIRTLVQNSQQNQQRENGTAVGPITAPPLMPPPPVPPPLPPARIRISPRQVGAGEALTTPLGVSLSSPPRHRIKRDCRQGFYRSTRIPYRRFDATEPGPSSPPPFFLERPNYFFGLKIIPQFQTSILCSPNLSSGYSDSASDSSGSDENPQLIRNSPKHRPTDGESACEAPPLVPRHFDLLRNVQDLQQQKLRQTILHNYNLSLPNTNSKFFFPLSWDNKTRDNPTLPSTSGNHFRFFQPPSPNTATDSSPKVSNCVQYTFPTIHEGLNQNGVHSVVTNTGQPSRLRKFKKNIPYLSPEGGGPEEEAGRLPKGRKQRGGQESGPGVESESLSSMAELRRSMAELRRSMALALALGEQPSDFDQDGFQADESSNCMTSTDNSLEQICVSESNLDKKS